MLGNLYAAVEFFLNVLVFWVSPLKKRHIIELQTKNPKTKQKFSLRGLLLDLSSYVVRTLPKDKTWKWIYIIFDDYRFSVPSITSQIAYDCLCCWTLQWTLLLPFFPTSRSHVTHGAKAGFKNRWEQTWRIESTFPPWFILMFQPSDYTEGLQWSLQKIATPPEEFQTRYLDSKLFFYLFREIWRHSFK